MTEQHTAENDLRAEVLALVGEHRFDYTEWDTGVSKCRHLDHRAGYFAGCSRAWLREQLPRRLSPRSGWCGMKPLKAEADALAAVMMTPLSDFISDKEAETHKDPEGLAQKRMFTKAIEAVDEARGARTMWMVVLRFGTVPSSVIYQGFGPYATQKQASDATESILRATEATAYAVVPMRTHDGWEAMLAAADEPSAEKGQWAEVKRDAAARKSGWRGKARERDGYLK